MRDVQTQKKMLGVAAGGTVLLDALFGKGVAHLFGIPL
jgi:hypothetical protein